ncbi:AAA family ATPase [Streptomyces sp. DSM 44915]|uniref:AAA family ATPase n=1 Tax=Streptomyces chisholmiae TaxID=3075540 RepID=A0ABU2JSU2_9ACTN|nr:AAA family ATPase [Streptomyces sp. DSM 44915]MDT0268060.1 AAA family ATPase [Streptomyces sp. DSM 44915]
MELIERAEQLGALMTRFDQCVAGRGGVALIKGSLSVGKTAFLHDFHESVRRAGATLLTATGARTEQGLRLGLMRQLFAHVNMPSATADRVGEVLEGRPPEPSAPAGEGPYLWRDVYSMATLSQAVLELSHQAPIVLSVDDVHFGDVESLETLLYLQRRVSSARVLLVLTVWERSRTGNALFRAEVTRHPHMGVRLAPLSPSAVEELVAKRVGAMSACDEQLDHYALTHGNPLLLQALIEDQIAGLTRARPGPREAASWPTFVQAVSTCMHRWDPELLSVARGYAILGGSATPRQVAQLVDVQAELVEESMKILAAAGLADAWGALHSAIATAVQGDIEPAHRTALHARAAELCYESGAQPLVTARHLIAADQVVGPWGIKALRAGAEHALVDDDLALATRCLTLALRECEDESERISINTTLGRVEWLTNPSSATVRLSAMYREAPDRPVNPREGVAIVRSLLWQGEVAAANQVFEKFRDRLDELDPQALGSLRFTALLVYGGPGRGLPPEIHRQQPAGLPATLRGGGVLDTPLAKATTSETVRAAEHILTSSPLDDGTLEALAHGLLALIKGDEAPRAVGLCDSLLQDSARRGATTWQTVFGSIRADLALRLGDLPGAIRFADAALQRIDACGPATLVGYPLGVLVQAHSAVGDHDQAAEALRRVVPENMFDTVFGLGYLHARGHHRLKTGRLLEAIHDIQTCGKLAKEWGVDVPAFLPWRTELALAHLTFGHRDAAHRLLSEQLSLATCTDARSRGLTLRLLAECGDPRHRTRLLKKSVKLLELAGDRFELFRSLADLGRTYEEMGELDQARSIARRAKQEAPAWHAARQQQSGVGQPARAEQAAAEAPLLSEAEHRVATLAAQGYTNREIGRKLYITVSTVEQHLTRVYRKLKVSRRTDLPQAAQSGLVFGGGLPAGS